MMGTEKSFLVQLFLRRWVIVVVLIPLLCAPVAAQAWHKLKPELSERFNSLSFMDNGGLVGAIEGDGLIVRRPGGEWVATSPDYRPGIQFSQVLAIDELQGTVLASATTLAIGPWFVGGGIYRSTDYGETWTFIEPDPGTEVYCYRLGYSKANPSRVYLAANEDIFASDDAGRTWHSICPNTSRRIIFTDVAVHPQDADILVAGARGDIKGIFGSIDGGATWLWLSSELHVATIDWDPLDPHLVIAAGMNDALVYGVLRSVDGGATWTALHRPDIRGPVEFMGQPGYAVAKALTSGGNGALYATRDGGLSWFVIKEFTDPTPSLKSWHVRIEGNLILLAAALERYGVYVSADHGGTWRYSGPSRGRVVEVEADETRPGRWFAGTNDYLSVVAAGPGHWFLSEDAGATWEDKSSGWPATGQVSCALFSPTDPLQIHVGSDYVAGALAYTLDAGTTWNQCTTGMPRPHCVLRSPADPEILFVGHDRSLSWPVIECGLWSRDQAWNWTQLWKSPHPVQDLAIFPSKPDSMLAALGESTSISAPSAGGGLFKSTDGGSTWSEIYAFAGRHVAWISEVPGQPGHYWLGTLFGTGVFKSTDYGATWSDELAALFNYEVRDMLFLRGTPGRGFAATDNGVLESVDWGVTWVARNTGLLTTGAGNDLLSLSTHSICADEQTGKLILGTTAGLFAAQY